MGFAAGVMIAASVWSLLIPSIEMTEQAGSIAWIPACVGFFAWHDILVIVRQCDSTSSFDSDKPEGPKTKLGKSAMLVLAVTLHNIPEGMAVGVTFAGVLIGNTGITLSGAFCPGAWNRNSKLSGRSNYFYASLQSWCVEKEGFLYGVLSGLVEPVGAMLTILLTGIIVPFLPYFCHLRQVL